MSNWWDDPAVFDPLPPDEPLQGCAAGRMWRAACKALSIPNSEASWQKIVDSAPPDSLWHSLRNCVAYQAGVWQNMVSKGFANVLQPAAFKMAIVLRHTPTDVAAKMITELLEPLPEGKDLTSYILALLTDDEALKDEDYEDEVRLRLISAAIMDDSEDENDSKEAAHAEAAHAEASYAEASYAEAACAEAEVASSNTEAEPVVSTSSDNYPRVYIAKESPVSEAIVTSTTDVGGEESVDGMISTCMPSSSTSSSSRASPVSQPSRGSPSPAPSPAPAPVRQCAAPALDLLLFGDCELAVLAASRLEYDAHAKLVRAEYSTLTHNRYVQLRIKVLNQFAQIPKLYNTTEFECFEAAARENINREIATLTEHLASTQSY